MDIAVLSPGKLSLNGETVEFSIPALCMEIKTNIDKNMLSGIESSVGILKRTFPQCRYYAMGEFSDFDFLTQNYASTGIDEILIVRKQKRSVVRRNPSEKNRISEDLLISFVHEVTDHFKKTLIAKPNLDVRMQEGHLT